MISDKTNIRTRSGQGPSGNVEEEMVLLPYQGERVGPVRLQHQRRDVFIPHLQQQTQCDVTLRQGNILWTTPNLWKIP